MKVEHRFEQLQLLYELTQAVNRADEPGEIYRVAVEGLVRAVAADRASVMIFDADGVMRYKMWKGVSDRHRATMERPISINWRRGARNIKTVTVGDVRQDLSLSALLPAFADEGIRALALIPLLGNGGLIGKFVLYYNEPHEFLTEELQLAQTIATHVAFAAERHLAEAALRESEERFRNIADTAPVGIWITGPDGLVSFYNEHALRFVNQTMEQIAGSSGMEYIHPDDRESVQAAFSSCLADRSRFEVECRLLSDGEYRWVLCSGVPRYDSANVLCGYIGSFFDITDFKRARDESFARQKLESMGLLAGGIAHDFNNLLGGILAEAELAETDLAVGLAPIEEIHRIKLGAIRGAEIVRELMIYAGQDRTALIEQVDVSRLVKEMLELLKVSISKNAVLKTDLHDNLPKVSGNATQIRQLVMNLVINGSEAIGEKEGTISVTTTQVSGRRKVAGNIAPDLPAGDYVRLEVSDTGCGMTEAAKAKIFDPFFSTKFPGRGLGLAVVKGIIRAHGGTIDLKSSPGAGTTFQIFLPCTPQRTAEVHGTTTSARVQRSHALAGTVVVVEDDETLRLAVSKALRRRGFSVMVASNGSEAMHLLSTHKSEIDGVLLDVTIPGTSSREVLEKVRKTRTDLKMIVTSAYSKETVDAILFGLKVDHFIRKPFQLIDLVRLFGDVLSVNPGLVPRLKNSES